MHSFGYKNGTLHCEETGLPELASQHGTPLYVYSANTVRDHFSRLDSALAPVDHLICYAVKANSNIAILNLLAQKGAGFDIVSGGELFRVLKAGGKASNCTFAGVGKTRAEIEYALTENIYSFNVESESELHAIDQIAGEMGKVAPVALRVNPNVDAKTHKYISTGKSENKFGIDFERVIAAYAAAATGCQNIRIRGVQMHIGSQLTSTGPFAEAVKKVLPLVRELKNTYPETFEFFSIGGGIGIVYNDSLASGTPAWWEDKTATGDAPMTIADYGEHIVPLVGELGIRILLEPGRFMVGNSGVLLSRVLYEKHGSAKTFKIVDSGMNDLIRPALYEGYHQIVPVTEPTDHGSSETVDIVGPICESGDFFAQDRQIPPVAEGDLIALMSAGAYAFTMASNYNSRPLPAEILVDGNRAHVIRERQSLDDLVAGEHIPA